MQLIKCPYCRRYYPEQQIENEHVIARSWYPKNVPQTFQHITVPACGGCNDMLGTIEEDILHRLAICLPDLPEFEKIISRTKRGLNPEFGKNKRDALSREQKRKNILKDTVNMADVPQHQIMPFTQHNYDNGSRTGIRVPTIFDKIIEKWIRGVHLHNTGEFIPDDYVVGVKNVEDEFDLKNYELVRDKGKKIASGPGIVITQWTPNQNDTTYFLYTFEIWDRFKAMAVAMEADKPIRWLKTDVTGNVIII